MITNICIVGLLKKYTKSISKRVADTLDMFYADVTELLEYEYINMANAEKIVGKEYMEKQEVKKIKALSTFENTLFTVDTFYLNNEKNLHHIKNGALVIYLQLSQKMFDKHIKQEKLTKQEEAIVRNMAFERDLLLKDYADIVVDITTDKNIEKLILTKIEEYYEK